MRKFLIPTIAAFLFVAATQATYAAPSFNWGTQINPGECDRVGKPVINIVEKIVNTVDSGQVGNYWAYDNLNRQIQVWEQEDGSYCALVQNEGKFDAQEGEDSPGATGVLDGDEDGVFQGGYRAIINGTLKVDSDWKTRGFVGTTDYRCDLSGVCPGYISWVGQYFEPGYSFAYDWWGWIYRAGKNGVWINSSDGNSGDIL